MDTAMSQASTGQEAAGRATRVVMIPSASGGGGHTLRTTALARAGRMEGGNHLACCTSPGPKSAEGVLAWTSPI